MQPAPTDLAHTAFAPVFAALGDPTRLTIVATLSDGTARSISELTTGSEMTRQAMTKHLKVLEAAGLVASERSGRETRFAFCPDRLDDARDELDAVAARWDAALARLKAFAERD